MGNAPWYRYPFGWVKCIAASVGWSLFSWATGYKGFVCDFACDEQLPCEKWFIALDAKGEADTARVLARKIREEHYQAVIDQALREACWKLRGEASAEGNVCGPCFECRLEPYYGWAPKETCGEWREKGEG